MCDLATYGLYFEAGTATPLPLPPTRKPSSSFLDAKRVGVDRPTIQHDTLCSLRMVRFRSQTPRIECAGHLVPPVVSDDRHS